MRSPWKHAPEAAWPKDTTAAGERLESGPTGLDNGDRERVLGGMLHSVVHQKHQKKFGRKMSCFRDGTSCTKLVSFVFSANVEGGERQ